MYRQTESLDYFALRGRDVLTTIFFVAGGTQAGFAHCDHAAAGFPLSSDLADRGLQDGIGIVLPVDLAGDFGDAGEAAEITGCLRSRARWRRGRRRRGGWGGLGRSFGNDAEIGRASC